MPGAAEAGLSINPNWIIAAVVLLGIYWMTSASACPATTTPNAALREQLPAATPHLAFTAHLNRKRGEHNDLLKHRSAFVNAMNGMEDLPVPLGESGPAGVK